ncbi:MAG: hypothetical protein KTR29_17875, partial [Rhodothermaceae bacterium]|nr:hypothetical protein [Rhodothermaceae bacterium]
ILQHASLLTEDLSGTCSGPGLLTEDFCPILQHASLLTEDLRTTSAALDPLRDAWSKAATEHFPFKEAVARVATEHLCFK